MNYGKIQEYKRNGLKKSQVARRLGIDYKTVLKYWNMPLAEYAEKYIVLLWYLHIPDINLSGGS